MDLYGETGNVDLLKIDIEGGEWRILSDSRLAALKARVIVMEWHERGSPSPNPHDSAVSLLEGGGYTIVEDRLSAHRQNGVVWAAREVEHLGGSDEA